MLHKGRVLAPTRRAAIVEATGAAVIGEAFTPLTGDGGEEANHERAVLESERAALRPRTPYLICLYGIVWREGLRFLHQRERFVSALVRPLVWLFIFAAGFRQTLGVSIIPPYETYVLYEVYITPGLMAMIQLFNGMQSSLSMVYDREMGNMRMLLVSPVPRWFLLTSQADRRRRRLDAAGLRLSGHRLVLGDRAADLVGLSDRAAGAGAVRPDARRARHAAVLAHQAAREFRRRDEFRDLPDVLRLLGALSAVAGAGGQPVAGDRLPSSIRSPMRSS